jgi:hypothetical protein
MVKYLIYEIFIKFGCESANENTFEQLWICYFCLNYKDRDYLWNVIVFGFFYEEASFCLQN